jgi:hypothetical protein
MVKDGRALGLILLLFACASPRAPRPDVPAPAPSIPPPTASSPSSWTFSFLPGAMDYRISRSGVVESRSDPADKEITANSSHETITLRQLGDTIVFTAVVDTFSTTVQRTIGSTQPAVTLPFQLSGQIIADTIHISSDTLGDGCSAVATAVITDLHNLLPRFPVSLSIMSSWRDSTETVSCQASIPMRSRVDHSYSVAGESSYNNAAVLVIQRVDSIHAEGEGAQQQHHVMLSASGTGAATYYVDTATGHVVHLSVDQNVEVTVTASGKANHFRQTARQEFTLGR